MTRRRHKELLLVLAVEAEHGVTEFTGRICYPAQPGNPLHQAGCMLTPTWKYATGTYDIYAELVVTARLDIHRHINSGHPYGWQYEYRPYRVGTDRAVAMAAFLRRTDEAIRTVEDRDGYPGSLGEYVARFAAAIGITGYATRTAPGTPWMHLDDPGMRAWIAGYCHHLS